MKKIIIPIIIIFIILALIIFNYIYTNNYNFKLKGSDKIILNIGDKWEDPLYEIENNKEVNISNNIDYNQIGEYEVNYSTQIGIFKKTIKRKIIILNSDEKADLVFNLKGSNPYYLLTNHEYQEDGYEASDNVDGSLTDNVIVSNNIENKEGTYEVKYQVKNSNGIAKTLTRKVVIYSLQFEGKLKTQEYTQSNDIILNITDSNYSHTILPDGNKTEEKIINYTVLENKAYTFIIYDTNNNSLNYEIEVNNIDKEKPTGSCTLSLQDTSGIITVKANDNKKLKGYEYQYGNNKTDLITQTKYTINTMDENAKVTIYDEAGNSNTFVCNTIDNSTKQKRSYILKSYNYNGTKKQYWFYEPKISKREKVPLLIYFHGAGGGGSTAAVNNIAIPKNIKDGEDFPYYVVAPYKGTEEGFVLSLIDNLTKKYQIDTNRIVLSGGSMGSPPALSIAANNPNKFSCIVVIAAYSETPKANVNKLTKIPIWFFQGSDDSYSKMESFINKINKAGGNAKITPYKGGHDAPVNAFLRTDLTNWILNNKTK